MGRNIEIDARRGGGAPHEILFGEVTIEATAMHQDGTKTVFPDYTPVGISNGLAVLENVDVSPDGPEPAWAYRMTFRNSQTGRGWTELVGVPAGTGAVKYPTLPRFTTAIPPETTAGMLQNWVDTTETNKDIAVAAAATATAPTDEMVAGRINTPGSATATALSGAIVEQTAPALATVRSAGLARAIPPVKVREVDYDGVWLNDLSNVAGLVAGTGVTVQEIPSTLPNRDRTLRVTLAAGTAYGRVSFPVQADLTNSFVSYRVKTTSNFSRLGISFATGDTTHNSRYEYSNALQSLRVDGEWTQVTSPMGRANPQGNATGDIAERRNIKSIRLELHPTSTTVDTVIEVSGIRAHQFPMTGMVIVFDDGWLSSYTKAWPIMDALGLTGNIAVSPFYSAMGAPDYMTTAQLQEMYMAGWGMINHTSKGGQLATMTPTDRRTAISGGYRYLIDNGMPDDAHHLIYPGGSWNADVLAECRRQNVSTSRVVGAEAIVTPGIENRLLIQPWYITKNTLMANAKAGVDKLLANGGISYLTFHNIADVLDTKLETWTTANFQELMEYIAAKGVKTYRPSQVWG